MNPHEQPPSLIDRTRLMTAEDVATLLQVSQRTVHRLAKAGRIERVRISHKVARYSPDSVAALITASTTPSLQRDWTWVQAAEADEILAAQERGELNRILHQPRFRHDQS